MVIDGRDLEQMDLDPGRLGGKAVGLARLVRAGCDVPAFFVVPADGSVDDAVRAWKDAGGKRSAVRSSAVHEDGTKLSFAGLYETVLGVTDEAGLRAAIARCRDSALAERVTTYEGLHGLAASPVAVIVQDLVEGDASGVLFTVDPMDPGRSLVSAGLGLGEGVVQGAVPTDTFRVGPDGVVASEIVSKTSAVRLVNGAPAEVAVPSPAAEAPALTDPQVLALVRIGKALEKALGRPQDIEWTRAGDRLVVLQTRPITQALPSGRPLLWDNSNIIESYHGLVSPLTYSFASRAYTIVYQLFSEVMGVDQETIRANAGTYTRMIGLVRGRIYYNLNAWYRVVSLLPGYRWNRAFLEQMMGVQEVAGEEEVPQSAGRLRHLPRLVALLGGFLWRLVSLDKDIASFKKSFDEALGKHRDTDLRTLEPHAILDVYGDLERRLLWGWSVPIVNDFFVMIFFGVLRSLTKKWVGEEGLANALVAGEGTLESLAPTLDALKMAERIRADDAAMALFQAPIPAEQIYERARGIDWLATALDRYLAAYGDRCVDELKLEVPSMRQEPAQIVTTLQGMLHGSAMKALSVGDPEGRRLAEEKLSVLSATQRPVFSWVLAQARRRVSERESLRFRRTRIFGFVRDLFRALGAHLAAAGAIAQEADVFWLTVDEVFGWVRGTAVTVDLRGLVAVRKAEYERWRTEPEPADRFRTWGPVWAHNRFTGKPAPKAGAALSGTPCSPGVVEGPVRFITDPRTEHLLEGEILVAYRTDPGWVPLFPRASALLVERGSLLSHSAVVAREMAIPTIVGITGLTATLRTGDRVRMDGTTGTIEILERAP